MHGIDTSYRPVPGTVQPLLLSLHRAAEHTANQLFLPDDEDGNGGQDDQHNAGDHHRHGLRVHTVEHADADG